jgi:hypothetical protein
MNMEPRHQQHPTLVWSQPHQEAAAKAADPDAACYLDEDTVTIVLMQAILRLSPENRRKVLMFMHQAQHPERIAAAATAEPDGRLELRLTYQEA